MIKQDAYGSAQRPAWKYEDLGKATHAVLTIRDVDPEAEIPDDEREEGFRNVLTLTFEEDGGEKTLYTNYTMVGYLIEQLGPDEKKWGGQKIVVHKTEQKFGKKRFKKVAVAPPDEWEKLIGGGRAKAKAKARK